MMRLNDAADDCEAEADTFSFRAAQERRKGASLLFFAHPGAGVFEFNNHAAWAGTCICRRHTTRGNCQGATFGHRFGGVEDEIEEDLFELGGVRKNWGQGGFKCANEANFLVGEL